ncbi:class A beta-lactamase [Methylobacterium gregans]|uniref:Beta-lactamase n=1 Tax=Methylobacterium gregans TaxID=374424 RepID=A0AA37HLA1_9HYPH|nr:class A beta-lactamase [Methylobacterium gregans]MDQ0519848.1 beta-lactamase class A [Methylobacterium gregans]GJD77571.1 Beta-lactamase [Methylobacterium gregans]GLS54032.1 beta-lactamase [Methylobacterium gregans]
MTHAGSAPTRRGVAGWLGAGLALAASGPLRAAGAEDPATRLAALAAQVGGRVGVALRDTGTGETLLSLRAQERFPLCSTFKVLAAAAILARVERGAERLERALPLGADDLQSYAPVARAKVEAAGGRTLMSLEEACAAALVWSDNTAANLLLDALGGPDALTAFLREQGDATTRLDRREPDLNTAIPGDPRDTTTPAAMAATLDRLLLRDGLAPASRARLEGWMRDCRTGLKRLRAGLPADWTVGDRTGSGDNGTANTVALLRPPGRAPLVATVYITGAAGPVEARDAAHAEIGRIVTARVAGS